MAYKGETETETETETEKDRGVAYKGETETETETATETERGVDPPTASASVLTNRVVYLDWIGVSAEHRGKRLGEYISVRCLKSLVDRGEGYCTLWTQPSRVAAIRLYERLGFVQIARVVALERSLV